jgi:hypothetical protein
MGLVVGLDTFWGSGEGVSMRIEIPESLEVPLSCAFGAVSAQEGFSIRIGGALGFLRSPSIRPDNGLDPEVDFEPDPRF